MHSFNAARPSSWSNRKEKASGEGSGFQPANSLSPRRFRNTLKLKEIVASTSGWPVERRMLCSQRAFGLSRVWREVMHAMAGDAKQSDGAENGCGRGGGSIVCRGIASKRACGGDLRAGFDDLRRRIGWGGRIFGAAIADDVGAGSATGHPGRSRD